MKKIFKNIMPFLAGAVGGGILGFLGVKGGVLSGDGSFSLMGMLLGSIFFFYLSVMVHELGHLVFGWLTGYKFGFFKLGSLSWFKEDGAIRFKRSKNFAAGQCLMFPQKEEDFKFVLYNLGGGIFNLVLGVLLLGLNIRRMGLGFWNEFIFAGILINLFFAVTNLVPYQAGLVPNDGANIREALKSEDAKRGFYLMLASNQSLMEGRRYQDLDPALFQLQEEADWDNYFVAYIKLLEVEYLLDRQEYQAALALLDRLEGQQLQNYYMNSVRVAKLYLLSVYLPDPKAATAIYEDPKVKQFLKIKLPPFAKFEIAYAAFVKEDLEQARILLKKAKKTMTALPNQGERVMELEQLQLLEAKMEC